MNMQQIKRNVSFELKCIIALIIYTLICISVYFIAGESFKSKVSEKSITSVEVTHAIGEMLEGHIVEQKFTMEADIIESFSIIFATYSRANEGNINVKLVDVESGNELFSETIDMSKLQDYTFHRVELDKPLRNLREHSLKLVIFSPDGAPGNAVTLWYNPNVNRFGEELTVNGQKIPGTLCYTVEMRDTYKDGIYYLLFVGIIGVVLLGWCLYLIYCKKTNRKSYVLALIETLNKYRFLLRQLVSRDFKTKYKRSALGVLWSFLNPLLTMVVQYVVFSTLFKTDIPNFAVYLLIGIVFFNFFSESTNMGLMSIVSNSSLITKVYIPKYMFPISRVLSSAINLLISMVPLVIAVFIARIKISITFFLLIFGIACTIIFCMGMSLILSSAMVYFRDTQFLWNVFSMLWMYATPIFYPESILPRNLLFVFKLNPIYHFIRFSRCVVLEGISPEPQAYLLCILASIIPFILGVTVFRKAQKRFVLMI